MRVGSSYRRSAMKTRLDAHVTRRAASLSTRESGKGKAKGKPLRSLTEKPSRSKISPSDLAVKTFK